MRVAGIAFSMYVAAGVGAEGMGLYQLTYSAFTLAVTMATAGISVAVTRVLTEEQGMNRRGSERPVMRCALSYAALVSLAAAVCVLLGSGYIGRVLLSDERTVLSPARAGTGASHDVALLLLQGTSAGGAPADPDRGERRD